MAGERVTYDHVIVGAGSAGCAVAAGLARAGARVMLVEAGPEARDPRLGIPAMAADLWFGRHDWAVETEPQPGLDGRRDTWPRGRVVGGSSAINAMMWVRGVDADYDGWAEAGADGWDAATMRRLLLGLEDDARGPGPDRGTGGPVRVEPQRDPRPATLAFLAACDELGIPVVDDYHAREGAGLTKVTQRRGRRWSAADAFLAPARAEVGDRLTVRTGATVSRVVIEHGRAVGVELLTGRFREVLRAEGEVVLCAGAVASPALLWRSGVGPADELRALGLAVVADAPAVGADLQDHVASGMVVGTTGGSLHGADRDPRVLATWLLRRRGPATSNLGEALAFLRTSEDEPAPDVELLAIPAPMLDHGRTRFPRHGLTLAAIVLVPESRGRVTLAAADPRRPPRVEPGTFGDAGGVDLRRMVTGLRTVEALLGTRALRRIVDARLVPSTAPADDAALRAHARATGQTLYHPVGTCRMGRDDRAVVDPELRVRGVAGLRVADASVMPRIVRGHTNAAAMAIGVRAAELVTAG